MDDDEFGGFEAAESFEDGEMGTQSVSPAIPWAAFSTGQAVELAQSSSDISEHQTAEAVCLPEDESNYTLRAEPEENALLEQGTLMEKGKHVQQMSQPSLNVLPASTSLPEKRDPQSVDVLAGHMVAVETDKVETCCKETLENIEAKLSTADEKELRIKEEMFEKYSKLEEHLQEGKTEEISYEDSYNQLQDKHKQELEDLRKAGHDALSIIIEEFKCNHIPPVRWIPELHTVLGCGLTNVLNSSSITSQLLNSMPQLIKQEILCCLKWTMLVSLLELLDYWNTHPVSTHDGTGPTLI